MSVWPLSMQVAERGEAIGWHKGKPIPAWITTALGKTLVFDRVAYDDPDGFTPLAQGKEGEVLLAPGLIYRPTATASPSR